MTQKIFLFLYFSVQHDTSYRDSPKPTSNAQHMHVTSTPKHLPTRRAPISSPTPTHRARTEILDTAPQEVLSDTTNASGNYQSGYSLRLGPRQDDGFFRRPSEKSMPSRPFNKNSPKKNSPKKRTASGSKQKLTGKSKIDYKTRRRSPRNVSFVNAPGDSLCPVERSGGSRHRVLNESVKSIPRGRTPVRRRPQSAVTPEPSPIRQRYNLRRPNTATPKFGRSQKQVDHSPIKAPELYHSQFLNSYYANEPEENLEEIRVQRSHFPGRLLDDGNVRTPRRARRVLDTTPKPKSILLTPANRSIKVISVDVLSRKLSIFKSLACLFRFDQSTLTGPSLVFWDVRAR